MLLFRGELHIVTWIKFCHFRDTRKYLSSMGQFVWGMVWFKSLIITTY